MKNTPIKSVVYVIVIAWVIVFQATVATSRSADLNDMPILHINGSQNDNNTPAVQRLIEISKQQGDRPLIVKPSDYLRPLKAEWIVLPVPQKLQTPYSHTAIQTSIFNIANSQKTLIMALPENPDQSVMNMLEQLGIICDGTEKIKVTGLQWLQTKQATQQESEKETTAPAYEISPVKTPLQTEAKNKISLLKIIPSAQDIVAAKWQDRLPAVVIRKQAGLRLVLFNLPLQALHLPYGKVLHQTLAMLYPDFMDAPDSPPSASQHLVYHENKSEPLKPLSLLAIHPQQTATSKKALAPDKTNAPEKTPLIPLDQTAAAFLANKRLFFDNKRFDNAHFTGKLPVLNPKNSPQQGAAQAEAGFVIDGPAQQATNAASSNFTSRLLKQLAETVYDRSKPLSEPPEIILNLHPLPEKQAAKNTDASSKKTEANAAQSSNPSDPLPLKTEDSAIDSVLETILGTENNDSNKKNENKAIRPDHKSHHKQKGRQRTQKYFSFLDPVSASQALQPNYDRGLYHSYLNLLEAMMDRTRQNLATNALLGFNLDNSAINSNLEKTAQAKKEFKAHYKPGQTQAGLNHFEVGYKAAMAALSDSEVVSPVGANAIWLDRGTIVSLGNADRLRSHIQQLHQAGINLIYFETINAGYPIYPSKLVAQNPLIQGWDPLAVAIDESHRLGMELHAWVWSFAVGNTRHNAIIGKPAHYPGPVFDRYPALRQEMLVNRYGKHRPAGQHEYWLSPASEKSRAFLKNYYREIVENYAVDGLHLDYIRYPFQKYSSQMGYERVGQEAYASETGRLSHHFHQRSTPHWIRWKSRQVSQFVQDIATTMRAIQPDLILSAAVFPMPRASRITAIQQDWETWLDNGWVDMINPMVYTRNPQKFKRLIAQIKQSPKHDPVLYPGIAMHKIDANQLYLELKALKETGLVGNTLFASAYFNSPKRTVLSSGLAHLKHTKTKPYTENTNYAGNEKNPKEMTSQHSSPSQTGLTGNPAPVSPKPFIALPHRDPIKKAQLLATFFKTHWQAFHKNTQPDSGIQLVNIRVNQETQTGQATRPKSPVKPAVVFTDKKQLALTQSGIQPAVYNGVIAAVPAKQNQATQAVNQKLHVFLEELNNHASLSETQTTPGPAKTDTLEMALNALQDAVKNWSVELPEAHAPVADFFKQTLAQTQTVLIFCR
ncbi:MAG: family 10 glycosylhydrolase [Cyanobacteria bacterium P01_H01_bin.74]